MQPFTDPAMVATYAQSTPRKVPGFADLHRMAMLLLAERAPEVADILVVGAGEASSSGHYPSCSRGGVSSA